MPLSKEMRESVFGFLDGCQDRGVPTVLPADEILLGWVQTYAEGRGWSAGRTDLHRAVLAWCRQKRITDQAGILLAGYSPARCQECDAIWGAAPGVSRFTCPTCDAKVAVPLPPAEPRRITAWTRFVDWLLRR